MRIVLRSILSALILALYSIEYGMALLGVPGQHAKPSTIRGELSRKLAVAAAAYRRKDYRTLVAGITSDFTVELLNGSHLSQRQANAGLQQQLHSVLSVHSDVSTILSLRQDQRLVYARIRHHLRYATRNPSGRRAEVELDSTQDSTFVRSPRGLLTRRIRLIAQTLTIDGKTQ